MTALVQIQLYLIEELAPPGRVVTYTWAWYLSAVVGSRLIRSKVSAEELLARPNEATHARLVELRNERASRNKASNQALRRARIDPPSTRRALKRYLTAGRCAGRYLAPKCSHRERLRSKRSAAVRSA